MILMRARRIFCSATLAGESPTLARTIHECRREAFETEARRASRT
jgi:hypothetical protein